MWVRMIWCYHPFDHRPPGIAKVHRCWAIFKMEKLKFAMLQFLKNRSSWPLCQQLLGQNGIFVKKMFLGHFFYLIQISLLCAPHLCILVVLGGLISNGFYQPIIQTYMILFINLYAHKVTITLYDRLKGLWQQSLCHSVKCQLTNWTLNIINPPW